MIRMQFSFETDVERDFVRRIVDGVGCVTRLTHPVKKGECRVVYADAELPELLAQPKGGEGSGGNDRGGTFEA